MSSCFMDWDSAAWEEFAGYCNDNKEIAKVLAIGFDGKYVLDAGCATGRLAREISRYARSVVGVDASTKMIEYAERTNSTNKIRYEVADITSIRFRDNEFDSA